MNPRARHIHRLPRVVHPGAWWLWALGLAAAASQTTNPLLLALILSVAGFVVANRRGKAPWAKGFHLYLMAGLFIIGLRVGFRILLDGQPTGTVLFTLPELPLGEWAAGIRIGGPVSAESLLAAVYDGLRLMTLLCCIGAANTLANPKRLLKSVPSALYETGVAVVVALSVAPQLVASLHRVRHARRLRGGGSRGFRVLRAVLLPVLEDALDRSIALAASMDARGYGRAAAVPRRVRATTGALLLTGLIGLCAGTYGLLDGTTPRALGMPVAIGGTLLSAGGLMLAGRRVHRTVYRPDSWAVPEWVTAACGLGAAGTLIMTSQVDPMLLNPSLNPLSWPDLPMVPALGILLALVPAWATPPSPDRPSGNGGSSLAVPQDSTPVAQVPS